MSDNPKDVRTEQEREALLIFFNWCYQNLSYPTRQLRADCEHQMHLVAQALGKLDAYFPGTRPPLAKQ